MSVDAVTEGLNIYRAVEACGERIMGHWTATSNDPGMRTRALARSRSARRTTRALWRHGSLILGGRVGPTCVDYSLTDFVSEAEKPMSDADRLRLFNFFLNGAGERGDVLARCMGGIRTALEQGDPDTKVMLQAILVDEKRSMDRCNAQGSLVRSRDSSDAG